MWQACIVQRTTLIDPRCHMKQVGEQEADNEGTNSYIALGFALNTEGICNWNGSRDYLLLEVSGRRSKVMS